MSSKRSGHITLIGMPTSGKTKVGKKLAEHLGYEFVDIDDRIVEEFGAKRLQDVVDELSEDEFKKLEEEIAIRTVHSLKKRTVIATGGSVIYYDRAMQELKKHTRIVHLQASFATVERRVAKNPDRGIVFAPGETIKHLYERRMPMYQKWAEDTICTDGKRSEAAKQLAKMLR